MITYYQPWLKPFIGKKKTATKPYLYYHSFEDALWDLLEKRLVPKKSVLLVPDFYCKDVLDNVVSHGYRFTYYSLDKHFQPNLQEFNQKVKTFRPKVIVVFHACGISSKLLENTGWVKTLETQTIIIEDSVHRLINPTNIQFINDDHYVIDSLRKVSPLPGSRMFGTKKALSSLLGYKKRIGTYGAKSFWYYCWFRLFLKMAHWSKSGQLARWTHEVVLKKHDDIIGDSLKPYAGLRLIKPFIDRLNYRKVEEIKKKQVEAYSALIKEQGSRYKVSIQKVDYPLVHVYPVGFNGVPPETVIEKLRKIDTEVWFKFPKSKWSQNKSVLFLPLGFHVANTDIRKIAEVLNTT